MATGKFVDDDSYAASADLSAVQFHIVELTGASTVNVCNSAADIPIGVLQNDPKSGEAATVRRLGKSKVVSDGSGTAIAVGDHVGTNASGRAVKKVANNDFFIGRALAPSTANGVIITVDLDVQGYLGA